MSKEIPIKEQIAENYFDFTVKQGWKLAGFEQDIKDKSAEFAEQLIPLVLAEIDKYKLTTSELQKFADGLRGEMVISGREYCYRLLDLKRITQAQLNKIKKGLEGE